MRDARNSSSKISLPPRLPQDGQELDMAVISLGCRKQAELKARTRLELEGLIGVYPTAKEAKLWKRILRRACQDAIQQTR